MSEPFVQRTVRFPAATAERVEAARGKVSWNRFVVWAVERMLGESGASLDVSAAAPAPPSAEPLEGVPVRPAREFVAYPKAGRR